MATSDSDKEIVCHFKRGRVRREQELRLQKHTAFLVKELESEEIVADLLSYFILDKNDQEYIIGRPENKRSRAEQNERLIGTLMNRTPHGFDTFLDVLRATGHQHAYDTLTRDSQTLFDNPSEKVDPEVKDHVYIPVTSKTKHREDKHYAQKLQTDFSGSSIENKLHCVAVRVYNAESRIDNIEQRIGLTEEEKNSIQDLKEDFETTRTELERLRGMHAQQVKELHKKSEEIKTLQQKLDAQLKNNAELSKELRDRSEQLKSSKQKIEEQSKMIAQLETQVRKLDQQLKTVGENMDQLKQEMKRDKIEADKKISKLQSKQEEGRSQIKELQQQRNADKKEFQDMFTQLFKKVEMKTQKQTRKEVNEERGITQRPAMKTQNTDQQLNVLTEKRSMHAKYVPSTANTEKASSDETSKKQVNVNFPKLSKPKVQFHSGNGPPQSLKVQSTEKTSPNEVPQNHGNGNSPKRLPQVVMKPQGPKKPAGPNAERRA